MELPKQIKSVIRPACYAGRHYSTSAYPPEVQAALRLHADAAGPHAEPQQPRHDCLDVSDGPFRHAAVPEPHDELQPPFPDVHVAALAVRHVYVCDREAVWAAWEVSDLVCHDAAAMDGDVQEVQAAEDAVQHTM